MFSVVCLLWKGVDWQLLKNAPSLRLLRSGCALLAFSSSVVDMLVSQPPALWLLVPLVGGLAALTALADILMDGWGVERRRL